MALAVAVVCLVAIGVGGFLYFTKIELPGEPKATSTAGNVALQRHRRPRRRRRPKRDRRAAAAAFPAADPVERKVCGRDRAFRRRSARAPWRTIM